MGSEETTNCSLMLPWFKGDIATIISVTRIEMSSTIKKINADDVVDRQLELCDSGKYDHVIKNYR